MGLSRDHSSLHGTPTGLPRASNKVPMVHGTPVGSHFWPIGISWDPCGTFVGSQFPPWDSHGTRMGLPCKLPCDFHGTSMGPWGSNKVQWFMEIPWVQVHMTPMGFSWDFHGIVVPRMGLPRDSHGTPMGLPWDPNESPWCLGLIPR